MKVAFRPRSIMNSTYALGAASSSWALPSSPSAEAAVQPEANADDAAADD